ncbi:MAG: J domain-containing protein [Verrucomicrobia bacterium]|nr:J domain-containing protein [Verrucomicrobiota bacterium]
MADPWSILGLRADTADEKQVRSAYARLLKVHRPDQDPEGFQRLRSAYEQALEWLQFRAASEEDEPSDEEEWEPEEESPADSDPAPAPPSPLPTSWAEGEVPILPHKLDQAPLPELHQRKPQRPERDWPREWSYSIVTLDRALENPRRYLDIITMALRALAVDVLECGIPADAVECIISDAFDADAGLFGMTAPVAILTQLLQGGRTSFLNRAIKALERAGSLAHLTTLVQKLDECEVDAWSARTADVYFGAAGLVAMHQPFLAQSIMRKLRGFLNATAYAAEFDSLETRITRGMALRDLTPDCRVFWSQRLEHPEAACDWEAETSVNALNNVMLLGPMWAGYPLVKSVVPADVLANAWKYQWIYVAVFRLKKMCSQFNFQTALFAVIGGILLITGAHLATQVTPSTKRHPSIQVDKTRYELERENNLRRHLKISQQPEEQPGQAPSDAEKKGGENGKTK